MYPPYISSLPQGQCCWHLLAVQSQGPGLCIQQLPTNLAWGKRHWSWKCEALFLLLPTVGTSPLCLHCNRVEQVPPQGLIQF